MKKRLFALLLALSLALCCVACGQEQPQENPSDGAEQSQEQPPAETPEDDAQPDAAPEGTEEETPDAETPQDTQEPTGGEETPETPSATGTEGLLTAEEITTLEGLYGKPMEEVLEALSLDAEKASVQDTVSITFEGVRTISGQPFNETLNFSAEEGFYGVDYRTGFAGDRGSLPETIQQIYDDAVALYGEPNTYPGLGNPLSKQLEQGEITGMETWAASEGTTLTMQVDDMGDLVVVSLSYQITVSYN